MAISTFVALDLETMTAERTSACAIGLVQVDNGVISQKFYSLIKPIPDSRENNNSHVHGITPEMVRNAPTIEMLFPFIRDFIGYNPIVCHNAAFDMDVLKQCMDYHGLSGINLTACLCTYELTGLALDKACAKYKIPLHTHHDALDDAIACAKVFLAFRGEKCLEPSPGVSIKDIQASLAGRKYEHATLVPIDDESVDDKSTPFFHAKVVVTGTFTSFPNRNKIGKALQFLGADINTSISKKTNIVVMGENAGPSKIAKVESLIEDGYEIRIIEEDELEAYISNLYPNM